IRIVDDRHYWTFHCESCIRCMNICPPQAVETSHSLAAIMIAVTTSIPVSYWLMVLIKDTRLVLNEAKPIRVSDLDHKFPF
ncbi:MAG TPA: hypothetical protein PKI17_05075, partial [Syntrophomonas sp.]|nr:hypothetical protein [Syntrophomonas sp.]